MLPEGSFACALQHGVAVCSAKSPTAEAVYAQLSVRVKTALAMMAKIGISPPVQEITIGPTIGAAMVIACQGIIGMLGMVVPPPASLHPLMSTQTQPTQLVAIVGTHADEVLEYITRVLTAQPTAFEQAVTIAQTPPVPMGSSAQQAAGALFTKDRLLALGASVLVIGGIVWVARSSSSRLSGRIDRTGFLFPGVGGDDDGDDGGDYEDNSDEGAEDPPDPGVIDAESHETVEPAA